MADTFRRCEKKLTTFDELPDEWKDWLSLPPLERFARSERALVESIAMGGHADMWFTFGAVLRAWKACGLT